MEYRNEVFSKVLPPNSCQEALADLINVLEKHDVKEVELLFGFAWGNDYKDWTPFTVKTFQIEQEINHAESLEVGKFSNDDLYIRVAYFATEFLFCHESDIHLRYNDPNDLTEDVLRLWRKQGIIHPESG